MMTLIYRLLSGVLELYSLAIIIYALMSWVPNARSSRFGQLLGRIVSPLTDLIDDHIPAIMGMSFSPLIALMLVSGLQWLLGRIF